MSKNKIDKILINYLSMAGYAAIMLVMFHALDIMEPERLFLVLRGIVVGGVPVAVLNTFGFRTGMDKFELWVRRIVLVAVDIMIIVSSYVIVGYIKTPVLFLISMAGGFGAALIICIPAYILIDRREKKSVRQINDKLSEQSKKQEETKEEKTDDWH